ncbi:L,D-transpeptidase family protein [Sinorhizobium mexicanum]|uniref:L,D-transpeptidase family protein n=1 Tax=Sinorhizobium mexicanum TaxID=375549 RepID=A0A859QHM4_9HYPH|nr:L,D-transpeptidase family protein [Sinorhizobium mexicanum]MBP1882493.1 murein L,D-transpeptidase YafK [Sinorhizobium mexicanum]QLL62175.1 L,D-transpeptidase family protein [Sinorhizobium mexicanum]
MTVLRILKKTLLAAALVIAGAGGYTLAARHSGSGTPPEMAAPELQAKEVVVDKSARTLKLLRDGTVLGEYGVSLGGNPLGHKEREGDRRTPEGDYRIDWRNPNSAFHLSLHISYPDAADEARAAAAGESPGGDIMIHGLPNGWGFLGSLHLLLDWTDGCIAVTDEEMRQIWSLVPDGTPIRIEA